VKVFGVWYLVFGSENSALLVLTVSFWRDLGAFHACIDKGSHELNA